MRQLFEPSSMPSDDPVRSWGQSYQRYAQGAIAGPVILSSPLTVTSMPGDFYDSLDASLRTMWMSAIWIGVGVTALTAVIPSVKPFLKALSPRLLSSYDRELAPALIAEALHTYTLSITVSVVPISGTPFIVPLT